MIYLGIDPGAQGGLVALYDNGSTKFTPIPDTPLGIWQWFAPFADVADQCSALIERVGGYMGDLSSSEDKGGGSANGSAMFAFGKLTGFAIMALEASGIRYAEVSPSVWQKGVGIEPRRKGEDRTRWKNRIKSHAQLLFPRLKVTLSVADALLIAAYCKSEGV